ncbi:hypothetical protein M434DRAFT_396196 [Hypoxylon sp. CO27-5]|nr:hypothetical protein M434DRAFT_396196 [Hypoxylon sp. CO27-5]
MRPLSTHYWTWMVMFVGLHINVGRGRPMSFQYSISPNHRTKPLQHINLFSNASSTNVYESTARPISWASWLSSAININTESRLQPQNHTILMNIKGEPR